MARPKFFREEVDVKLRHQPGGRPQRLVPWWPGALRRLRVSGSPASAAAWKPRTPTGMARGGW